MGYEECAVDIFALRIKQCFIASYVLLFTLKVLKKASGVFWIRPADFSVSQIRIVCACYVL